MKSINIKHKVIIILTLALFPFLTSCFNPDIIEGHQRQPKVEKPGPGKPPEGEPGASTVPRREEPESGGNRDGVNVGNPNTQDPKQAPEVPRDPKDPEEETPLAPPVSCTEPANCSAVEGKPLCCISPRLVEGDERIYTPPTEESADSHQKKGTCSKVCEHPKIPLCTRDNSDEVCPVDTRCGLFNEAGVGRCVKKYDSPCINDTDCTDGTYCVANGLRNSVRHTDRFYGTCAAQPAPRALCNTIKSALPFSVAKRASALGSVNAVPFCIPSSRDEAPLSVRRTQRYGRIAYICSEDSQCTNIEPDLRCMWKTVEIGDTISGKKPANYGTCQKEHSDETACVYISQKFTDEKCYDKGLTCCRIGTSSSNGALGWHCADTTLSDGDCEPFDATSPNGKRVTHNYGKCVVEGNNVDTCQVMYGPDYTCTYIPPTSPLTYTNSICCKDDPICLSQGS